ncbi:hypothetical protein [Clostridium sp.]|uniref:hypothetical protein n=1 Tax=Clostridium sp. TaxID=1506 RepID=UPI002602AF03|nr:hypothetical protein [Clostridium sp.]
MTEKQYTTKETYLEGNYSFQQILDKIIDTKKGSYITINIGEVVEEHKEQIKATPLSNFERELKGYYFIYEIIEVLNTLFYSNITGKILKDSSKFKLCLNEWVEK